jgi:hypothetical protein
MQTLLLLQTALEPLQLPAPPLALAQHCVPRSPQVVQVPALQIVPGEVHAPVAGLAPQQDWPGPPQLPHDPALQTPPRFTQALPWAMQIPDTQHPPPPQVFPAQHCVPG